MSDQDVSFPKVSLAYLLDGSTESAIDVNMALKPHIDKIVSNTGNNLNTSSLDLTSPLPLLYQYTGMEVSLRY